MDADMTMEDDMSSYMAKYSRIKVKTTSDNLRLNVSAITVITHLLSWHYW